MKTIKILKDKIAVLSLLFILTTGFFSIKIKASVSLINNQIETAFSFEDFGSDKKDIFKLINKQREKYRLGDLQWDDELEKLAEFYSRKMAHDHFFSHYESNGHDVVDRARTMNIRNWNKIGENLFMVNGYKDINKFAVDQWMASPGHRENILDREYTDTGIGLAAANDGTIYITQVFIKKR